jgi:hypothetical protein
MRIEKNIFRPGFTLVEMMIAIVIAVVPIFAVGMLLVGSQRQWTSMFGSATSGVRQDCVTTTTALGSIGRRANKKAYTLYNRTGNIHTKANPTGSGQQVVLGDAVEFVYWDTDVNENLMEYNVLGTASAFFYLDNSQLKVNYGPYPPGALDGSGVRRTGNGIRTHVLARNVSSLKFSHTVINSTGMGSVRINMVLTDPATNKTITVKTCTLIRNTWPR